MIIDSHAHVGIHPNMIDNMKLSDILFSMEKYGIAFSLVSTTDAVEYDSDREKIETGSQVSLNKKLLETVKQHKDRLGVLLWMKPNTENVTRELYELIDEYRDIIFGLKFHPYHSQLPFDDARMDQYFDLARKYSLPIATHTATSYESSCKLVYKVAKANPDINFIMVHLGLGTDNLEAIELISKAENLFGDTTWVPSEKTVMAIRKCGKHKIMFGTDNPIDGRDTLGKEIYQEYLKDLKQSLKPEEYKNLMSENARRIFKLNFQKVAD